MPRASFSLGLSSLQNFKGIDFFLYNKESSLKHFVIVAQTGRRGAWYVSFALCSAVWGHDQQYDIM